MILQNLYEPIIITGAERSGSTLIAKILSMCGVQFGSCNRMFEHKLIKEYNMNYLKQFQFCFPYSNELLIPVNWSVKVNEYSKDIEKENPWMLKGGEFARIWQIWHYTYPNAKWLIVRRRTGDIIQSCVKTGYMKTFKSQNNLVSLGLEVEEEGWLWWVHRYEEKFVEMIHAGVNCRIVWVDRMSTGNYQQMYETVNWLGLNWNDKIPSKIGPLLKVKEVKDGSKNVSSISEANN